MADITFLNELFEVIQNRRKNASTNDSYVAKMSSQGTARLAQKVGEEAVETVIAAIAKDEQGLRYESADLLFHLMMLWADAGITPNMIADELYSRQCKIKPR